MNNISIFKRVADRYDRTKPIGGSSTPKELDIRPWGDRKRKWERVAKFDDNTYYITDTGRTWPILHRRDKMPSWLAQTSHLSGDEIWELMRKDDLTFAPIVVRREYEANHQPYTTIRVRLTCQGQVSASFRYFVGEVLWALCKMDFDRIGGGTSKHYGIRVAGSDTKHYLPKTTMDPKWLAETTTARSRGHGYQSPPAMVQEDGGYLLFREKDGQVILDERSPVHHVPKKRVDMELKEQYRKPIKDFVEHALSVGSLLHESDYYGDPHRDLFGKYMVGDNRVRDAVRDIIMDEDHPDRMLLAGSLLAKSDYFKHKARWNGCTSQRYTYLTDEQWEAAGKPKSRYGAVEVQHPPYDEQQQKDAYRAVRRQINAALNKWAEFTKVVTEGE